MLDLYKIEGAVNLDQHPCFEDKETFNQFQEGLKVFKHHINQLVLEKKDATTFYKFGDGDYRFLMAQEIGSAKPGNRALSVPYSEINLESHRDGANKCDYYTCEIYPENRLMFSEVIKKEISYPAEYGYGLVANKWFFKKFDGKIGLIGAKEKLILIQELMKRQEYKDYLGINQFNDYIYYPQKYACDDIDSVEKYVGEQLEKSNSKIFLLGIGHSKSAILHRLKKYTNSVFMDVGAGIDMIAGCINITRPYAGDWINYRINDYDYSNIDYLKYSGEGKEVIL